MFDHFVHYVSAWHSQRERVECYKPGIGALPVLVEGYWYSDNGSYFKCICFIIHYVTRVYSGNKFVSQSSMTGKIRYLLFVVLNFVTTRTNKTFHS